MRQAPVDDLTPAEEEDRRQPELGQEADEGVVEGLQARGHHRLVPDAPDAAAEALELALLAREGLHDAHAADVLLDVGRELGDPLLELLQRRARAPPVARGDADHDRDRDERDGRQARLHGDHRPRREEDGQRRLQHEDEAVAEEEAHGLQVDGGARHQLPGLLAVEEAQLELLQVLVHAVAQVELDAERDAARDQAPRDGERQAQHARGEDDEGERRRAPARRRRGSGRWPGR